MRTYSTKEAARKLNLHWVTLQRHILNGLVSAPPVRRIGGNRFREWTDRDIERVRKRLPKIANGRRKENKQKKAKKSRKKK